MLVSKAGSRVQRENISQRKKVKKMKDSSLLQVLFVHLTFNLVIIVLMSFPLILK